MRAGRWRSGRPGDHQRAVVVPAGFVEAQVGGRVEQGASDVVTDPVRRGPLQVATRLRVAVGQEQLDESAVAAQNAP